MHPFPAGNVAAALLKKGFARRENDHSFFHFFYDGKDWGVMTKISHGEKEIGIGLVKRMRRQMRLETNSDFGRFVDCALTHEKYIDLLKKQGVIR